MQTKEEKYQYNRLWRKANREKVREIAKKSHYSRKIRGFSPDQKLRQKAAYRKWRRSAKGREYMRRYSVSYYYGISWEDRETLLRFQKYRCAICHRKFNKSSRFPHIDHNKKTKKVRGLLCRKCNLGIGCLKDSADFCRRAADYLSKK